MEVSRVPCPCGLTSDDAWFNEMSPPLNLGSQDIACTESVELTITIQKVSLIQDFVNNSQIEISDSASVGWGRSCSSYSCPCQIVSFWKQEKEDANHSSGPYH